MVRLSRVGVALLTALQLAACGVTPEKLAHWKEVEGGELKLRDAVKDSSLAPSLRAQAFVALVEINFSNEGLNALAAVPAAERAPIVHEAQVKLVAMATGNGQPETVTRQQKDAKDALFLLRRDAAPADRDAIDDALIAWTTADLQARMSQGGQSSEKILLAIGPRAAPRLIALLDKEGPNQQQAAALLSKLPDPATRTRAAAALVESAKRTSGKTRDVPDAVLQSIGVLGGPQAEAYLIDAAEHGSDRLRERALFSLAQGGAQLDATALAAAARITGDKNVPGKVREAGFQLAEKIGVPAVPSLVKLLNDPNELVRWRAVEAALAAGKDKAVAPVLEGLPPTRAYKREDLDSYVVHDLTLIGPPSLPSLKGELKSKNWVARVVAVRALAVIGKAEDAGALASLTSDSTKLKGFPGNATLGAEAKAAEASLRAKR